LIIRNVSFEFRSKIDKPVWRTFWDAAFFIGSLIPAFIWGVIITNLITGVPIDSKMEFAGSFSDLVKPAALTGGLMGLLLFTFNGAVFLSLRTEGTLLEKVKKLSLKIGVTALVGEFLLLAALLFQGLLFEKVLAGIFTVLSFLLLAAVDILLYYKKNKPAMLIMGLSIVTTVGAAFSSLFPKVMVSSLDPAFSLDIFNAASSRYTLKVITISACILLPVIIIYQAWTYWIFRKRVNSKNLEY
jgi:cytochrome bd ubiquinol oxidase subunit II